jgi:hypothetical protein
MECDYTCLNHNSLVSQKKWLWDEKRLTKNQIGMKT